MRDRKLPTRIAGIAALVWMGAIFVISSLPGGSLPSGGYGGPGHFGGYLVLGALYFIALGGRQRGWQAVALAVLLASLYGVTDEFHQSFVPGRVPDPADWITDTAGATAGAAIAFATLVWRARSGRPVDTDRDSGAA
ncbi:MAG: VanZ family protein [Coriobacteriia bacterium]|nr:VanZ family protein [Coriobacteriia bacterium]